YSAPDRRGKDVYAAADSEAGSAIDGHERGPAETVRAESELHARVKPRGRSQPAGSSHEWTGGFEDRSGDPHGDRPDQCGPWGGSERAPRAAGIGLYPVRTRFARVDGAIVCAEDATGKVATARWR